MWAEQQDTVNEVNRQPADHEEKQDQEEGGGLPHLLTGVGAGFGHIGLSQMVLSGGRANACRYS